MHKTKKEQKPCFNIIHAHQNDHISKVYTFTKKIVMIIKSKNLHNIEEINLVMYVQLTAKFKIKVTTERERERERPPASSLAEPPPLIEPVLLRRRPGEGLDLKEDEADLELEFNERGLSIFTHPF